MHLIIVTKRLAFKALKEKASLTLRLFRKADKLSEYDFFIIYRSGKKNLVPKFLSRMYLVQRVSTIKKYISKIVR